MKARVSMNMQGMSREQVEQYARDPKNRYIVAIPILLVLAFLFYILAGFFSYLGGSSAAEKSVEQSLMSGVSDF